MTTPQRLLAVGLLATGALCAGAPAAPPEGTAAEEAKVKAKLGQRISKLSFTAVELDDVLQFFRDVTQLNVQVRWAALKLSKIDRMAKVTMYLQDVRADKALRTILDDVGEDVLDYEIHGNVILISTVADLDRHTEVRIYDLRDLKRPAKDPPYRLDVLPPTWKGPPLPRSEEEFPFGTGFFDEEPGKKGSDAPVEAKGKLAQLIRTTVDPKSWRRPKGGPGTISRVRQQFVIRQTRRNHEAIARLLDRLRATWRGPVVSVRARWITLPSKNAGVIFTKGNPPVAAADKTLEAAGGRIVYQGAISGFNGEVVYIVQGRGQTYVTGIRTTVCGEPSTIQPVTQGVLWGAALRVRPLLNEDRTVTAEVRSTVSEPKGVRTKPLRSTRAKGTRPGERKPDIELDCLDFTALTLSTTVRFALDTPVVVGGMTAPTEATDTVMYLVLEVSASKGGKPGKSAPK